MRILASTIVLLMLVVAASTMAARSAFVSQAGDISHPCGPSGTAHVRTTLYFGLARPAGTVSEVEWQSFLREQVTPQFPDGLTVWEADGQWRRPDGSIGRERAMVLLLVHDETPAARDALGALVTSYKREFQQESVLWESAVVCATF